MNIKLRKILRLTYRLIFPNNNVKIWDNNIQRGKLFTLRDLWEIDDEGTGAEKDFRTKISKDCSSRKKSQGKKGFWIFSWEACVKGQGVFQEGQA
jgi:hypothetical protein